MDGEIYTDRKGRYYNRNGWNIEAREVIYGEKDFDH